MKKRIWFFGAVAASIAFSLWLAYQTSSLNQPLTTLGELTKKTELDLATKEFAKDLVRFQEQAESALAWRASATLRIEKLRKKISSDIPLSADDLSYLHEGVDLYVEIREEILGLAHKYKHLVDPRIEIEIAPSEGTHIDWKQKKVRLDPQEVYGDLLIRQFKLSLASALLLYDNFLVAIWPYNETSHLRALVNFDNSYFFNSLSGVARNYLDEHQRKKVHLAARYFRREQSWRARRQKQSPQTKVSTELEHDYLDALILGSPTLASAYSQTWISTKWERLNHWLVRYFDSLNVFKTESVNLISLLVGNSVGLVETRKGKLAGMNEDELREVRRQLKPLDILLEKTPFRLTDKLIPGHYGHVAIWLGTKEDLVNQGHWQKPFIRPFQRQIAEGYNVLEALRSGVQLSKLEHFINVDDLAVLRLKNANTDELLQRSVAQIGKSYDFNFDIETDKKIVCSELIYVVYSSIHWPVDKTLGRFSISPDHVAEYALKNSDRFFVPLLFYDGKLNKTDNFEKMAELVEGS